MIDSWFFNFLIDACFPDHNKFLLKTMLLIKKICSQEFKTEMCEYKNYIF